MTLKEVLRLFTKPSKFQAPKPEFQMIRQAHHHPEPGRRANTNDPNSKFQTNDPVTVVYNGIASGIPGLAKRYESTVVGDLVIEH
jgi:hypothetical protein